MPVRDEGIPPWGLGLKPTRTLFAKLRNALGWRLVNHLLGKGLKDLNNTRASVGASPLDHATEFTTRPPILVSYTAEPFEYPRQWPENFRLVGPGVWEPSSEHEVQLPAGEDPLILVTCSTEFQDDSEIIAATLQALATEDVRVLATTGSTDPNTFEVPDNARVERYVPHGKVIENAACVVCHGGMGITQKALAAGVPVCVIPFGRDQLEVARHVEVCDAGTRLLPKKLNPAKVRAAVYQAIKKNAGAKRIQKAFAHAGGAKAAADAVEEVLSRSPRDTTHDPARQAKATQA
jgi:MGT family glycosyltransferase